MASLAPRRSDMFVVSFTCLVGVYFQSQLQNLSLFLGCCILVAGLLLNRYTTNNKYREAKWGDDTFDVVLIAVLIVGGALTVVCFLGYLSGKGGITGTVVFASACLFVCVLGFRFSYFPVYIEEKKKEENKTKTVAELMPRKPKQKTIPRPFNYSLLQMSEWWKDEPQD